MPSFYHVPAHNADGERQHVFIAVPVVGGFPAKFAASLWDYARGFERVGMAADLCVLSGDCHVDDARNSLVRRFLTSEADTFIFIDSDVTTHVSNLIRLAKYDRDVVAGLYPYKSDEGGFPVLPMGSHVAPEPDGLVEVESVPTGFLKIRRHVLEDLAKKAPKFYGKAESREIGKPIPKIFGRTHVSWDEQPAHDGGEWWQSGTFGDEVGGDYWFCRQWKATGGKIYADPNFMMTHIGEKEWSGCVGAWWREQSGLSHIDFDEMTRRLLVGQTTTDVFERWRQSYFNRDWAPATDFIEAAFHVASEAEGPIIECGSGLTTLALAMGAKISGQKVYVLEHDDGFLAATMNLLETYDLADHVLMRHAPLDDKWYSNPISRPLGREFTVAVIDGPPRDQCDRSAFFSIYGHHLAPRCRILIDDASDKSVAKPAIDECKKLGFDIQLFRSGKPFMIAKRNETDAETRRVA